MGLFTNIFKAFSTSESKIASETTEKVASKTATNAAKAARVAEVESAARKAASKPAELSTTPKVWQETGKTSILKDQAKAIASSKTARVAGKVAVTGVAVGGSVYALGALGGKGLDNLGYGWRGLTNNYTAQDQKTQDINNLQKENDAYTEKVKTMQDYLDFLNKNNLADSPSAREGFNNYASGNTAGTDKTNQDNTSKVSPWLIAGGVAAALGVLYVATKKKGK